MTAPPFVTFGGEHLAAMGTVLAGAGALAWAVRAALPGPPSAAAGWAASARLDRAVRWALAVACLAYEAAEIPWRVATGIAPLRFALPLHLCDVSILIAPVVLLTASRHAFELLYFWGIGGALQAIATPTLEHGFPAPICVAFFLGHGLILAGALYATVVMRLRPALGSILRVWLVTNAYALAILPLNYALGTNYLYVMGKPPTPSLLDLMGPWPWYLATLELAAVVVFFLCYLPFAVGDWARARRRGRLPRD